MPGGQCDDVDAVLGERLIDELAQLLALVGFVGALVVGLVHGVQGQDDALHDAEDLCVVCLTQPGKLALEGVEDGIGRHEQFFGEQSRHARALRVQSAGGQLLGFFGYAVTPVRRRSLSHGTDRTAPV